MRFVFSGPSEAPRRKRKSNRAKERKRRAPPKRRWTRRQRPAALMATALQRVQHQRKVWPVVAPPTFPTDSRKQMGYRAPAKWAWDTCSHLGLYYYSVLLQWDTFCSVVLSCTWYLKLLMLCTCCYAPVLFGATRSKYNLIIQNSPALIAWLPLWDLHVIEQMIIAGL